MARVDGIVLAAAGASSRFGGGASKVFARLAGVPLLVRAATPFRVAVETARMIVVVRAGDRDRARALLPAAEVVEGGPTRLESVRRGLAALPDAVETVLVHDASRPLVTVDLVRRVLRAARRDGAAAPMVHVRDALHRVARAPGDPTARVVESLDRRGLVLAQTPQAATADRLRAALGAPGDPATTDGDEATLLLAAGVRVTAVLGDPHNLQVVTPDDLTLAERLLADPVLPDR